MEKSKSITLDESNKMWDEWWNSLTNEQKQKLVEEQEAIEKDRNSE